MIFLGFGVYLEIGRGGMMKGQIQNQRFAREEVDFDR